MCESRQYGGGGRGGDTVGLQQRNLPEKSKLSSNFNYFFRHCYFYVLFY